MDTNNFFTILQEEKGEKFSVKGSRRGFLKIEIAIEGPRDAIQELMLEVKRLTWTPGKPP